MLLVWALPANGGNGALVSHRRSNLFGIKALSFAVPRLLAHLLQSCLLDIQTVIFMICCFLMAQVGTVPYFLVLRHRASHLLPSTYAVSPKQTGLYVQNSQYYRVDRSAQSDLGCRDMLRENGTSHGPLTTYFLCRSKGLTIFLPELEHIHNHGWV